MLKISLQKKYVIAVVVLIIPSIVALFHKGYFPMHDDIQGMRILQMQKCILDFQLPCRWVPDMGYGYGYPQFNYYGPLPYYIAVLPVLIGVAILSSVKLAFALSIVGSAIGMYLLGSRLWGKTGGVISALMYTYAPYRAVDVYVRGAMGEAWAFIFLPLILLFTLDIFQGKKRVLPLALSLAGLALSHNVTVIMFAPFYALFILLVAQKSINFQRLKLFTVAGIWGFLLSAFFTLPAYFEKQYVHVETILQGYFNYLAHFVGIKQLLLSTFWGYGVSTLGPLDGMSLTVGTLLWSLPLFVIVLLFYLKKSKHLKLVLAFTIFGFMSLFLIHPKSQFIWHHVGIFSYIQFPWRFLSIAVLFFSIAGGALGTLIPKHKKIAIGAVFIVLILFYGSFFKPKMYLQVNDSEKFVGESWKQQQTISIFDYLPKGAKAPPATQAPKNPYSENVELEVLQSEKGTDWQKWTINMPSQGAVVFPVFDFPNWQAKVDAEDAQIKSDNELGLITLNILAGRHEVILKLQNTPLRTFSNILSLVALLLIPIYIKKYEK